MDNTCGDETNIIENKEFKSTKVLTNNENDTDSSRVICFGTNCPNQILN